MKTVQVILLLALGSAPAWGSNAKVDSLKQLLEHHATADKAEVLWSIAYELFDIDNAQALFYGERAYHEVWKRGDSLQIVKVGTTYGQLLRRMGDLDQSISVSSRMLPIARRHEYRKYWKMLLNSLGVAYVEKARFDLAIGLNHQSLLLRQEDGDTMEIASAFINLGFLHYRLVDFDKSEAYLSRAIELIESIQDNPDWVAEQLSICYLNFGFLSLDQHRHLKAKGYFLNAISMVKRSQSYESYGNLLWGYAKTLLELGDLDSAKYYANKAIEVGSTEANYYALANSYLVFSRISLREGNEDQAEFYFLKAKNLDVNLGYPHMHRSVLSQRLRLLHFKHGIDDAAIAFDDFLNFSDSLELIYGRSRVNAMEVAFSQRENESKLKAQSSIMALQKENLDRQQTFVLVVSVLLVLLVVLSIALFKANQRKQVINRKLDKIVEERTKELSRHRDALQHVIEEERMRSMRSARDLAAIVGSLKGILHLAKIDRNEGSEDYLDKAIRLAGDLELVGVRSTERLSGTGGAGVK